MIHPKETHWRAENRFVYRGKTMAEISRSLNVTRVSLAQWAHKGDWMKKRQERQRESPQAALDVLKNQRDLQMKAMGDDEVAAPEAINSLNKITLLIEKLESHVEAIGPMLDTLDRFAQFVGANADAEECAVLYKWTEKFLDEERRKHS